MTKKEIQGVLSKNCLFAGCRPEIQETAIARAHTAAFSHGERITRDATDSGYFGILLSGHAAIYSEDEARQVLMKFVGVGEAFGIASLFASSPPATRIIACGEGISDVLFLSRSDMLSLIKVDSDGILLSNTLLLFADKISFLNHRLACMTAGSAERRLAMYFRSLSRADDGSVHIDMSFCALAATLDIGRASLYRALDALCTKSIITRNDKGISVISPMGLDNICEN